MAYLANRRHGGVIIDSGQECVCTSGRESGGRANKRQPTEHALTWSIKRNKMLCYQNVSIKASFIVISNRRVASRNRQ